MELKKIGVWSLGRIGALLGLIFGLIAIIILAIVQKIFAGLLAAQAGLGTEALGLITAQTALYIPIYYLISGFIGGILLAVFYNFLAKYIGGIKLEFKEASKKK